MGSEMCIRDSRKRQEKAGKRQEKAGWLAGTAYPGWLADRVYPGWLAGWHGVPSWGGREKAWIKSLKLLEMFQAPLSRHLPVARLCAMN